jgi:RND family efflux transporter MFP subunit
MPSRSLRTLARALAVSAACAGCTTRPPPAADPEPAVAVRTAPVERGPVERPVRAAGVVAAADEWDLSFKVGGLVASVLVREGEPLRRGQALATLEPTELTAAAQQAREALAKAERDLERARQLSAAAAVPAAALEDAATAAALARAQVDAAEFNLRRATIIAPDDGWVDRRLAEPGEIVGAGRPILHVSGSTRGFVVRAAVTDRDVLGVAAGDPATFVLDARPRERLTGRVAEIARSAARGTGTFEVEIRLEASRAARGLLAGLTGRVEIARTVETPAVVPLAAVQEGDGEAGAVFVVEGGRARRVPIRIAFLREDRVALAADLAGVERVVTDGATRLSDGARVRVVP